MKLLYLNHLNTEKTKVELDGYENEYNKLKRVYDLKYNDVYSRISLIVKGEGAATESQNENGIPEFWSTAIKNSKYFPTNQKDSEILKHLINIKLIYIDETTASYKIEFEFAPNEFFTETVLTKSFFFDAKTEELSKIAGCQISWISADKNPGFKKVKKSTKGKKNKKRCQRRS